MKTLARILVVAGVALALTGCGRAARVSIRLPSQGRVIVHTAGITENASLPKLMRWFHRLPRYVARPCPNPPEWTAPVTFDFRGPHGRSLIRATDHRPGTCLGKITYREIGHAKTVPLADDGFAARVDPDLVPNAQTMRNKAAAIRNVHRLLATVRLPAGSRPLTDPSRLTLDLVNARGREHRSWTVHLRARRVLLWEKAHPPRGALLVEEGSGTEGPGPVTTERDLGFDLPSGASIYFELIIKPGGWTRIDVDVQDTWVVARSPDEKLPAGVRTVAVHGPRRLARRITSPTQVARIVHWFDSLPVQQGPFSCSPGCAQSGVSVTVDFLTADGTKLASATAGDYGDNGEYDPIAFRVGGRFERPLVGDYVLRRIERLPR